MGEKGAVCILLMICIIGGAFLLGGLLFSRSVSTILQLVVACEQVYSLARWLTTVLRDNKFPYARVSQVMPCKQKSREQPMKTPEENGVPTEVFFCFGLGIQKVS